MGWFSTLFGSGVKEAGEGIGATLNGVGDAAIKMRSAITGDLPPEAKANLEAKLADLDAQIRQAQASVIIAEAQGASWLQRNWRPLLMLVIIFIVANNFILFPYASIFTDRVKMLTLPSELWALMTMGVGGYIAGRTVEKVKGVE